MAIMRSHSVILLIAFVAAVSGVTGCATVRTMPDVASYDHPTVFSGTRLDFNALTGDAEDLKKFRAAPPAYPLLDLPFSAVLDAIILPLTFPLAAYELVFD